MAAVHEVAKTGHAVNTAHFPASGRLFQSTADQVFAGAFDLPAADRTALLQQLGASWLVSTYQANKLLVARAAAGGLSILVRTFDGPMGLAVDSQRLSIGTRSQIWFLQRTGHCLTSRAGRNS